MRAPEGCPTDGSPRRPSRRLSGLRVWIHQAPGEDQLEHLKEVRWSRGIEAIVEDSGQARYARFDARLFDHLARRGTRGGVADVHEATGQRPAAVASLADEEHRLVAKDGQARVDLGRDVAEVAVSEERLQRFEVAGAGQAGKLCGQVLQAAVALAVEFTSV